VLHGPRKWFTLGFLMSKLNRRHWLLGISAGTFPARALAAQTPGVQIASPMLSVADRRQGFHENLSLRGEALSASQFAGVSNRAQWESIRPRVLTSLRWELGLPAGPRTSPLQAQTTSRFEREGYAVENVVFQSSPDLYVTGNLYLPARSSATPAPAVIYVCGHAPSPLGAKVSYQHHAIWFARNGFAVFVLDTLEFAEIAGLHHGTHDLEMWHWLSLGYNPAGVEVWNAIRALDYLTTRREIDAQRVAITGRSGGGAVSWFTAAVDDRFQVASPVHGTWTVGPHIRHHTVRENCDCIYVWNSDLLDLTTIGALIAPRPLMIVNASRDGCFPPSGYQAVERQLRKVYSWYGADEKVDAFEDRTDHEDTFAYRKAANLWISRWLTGQQPVYSEQGIEPEADPSVLRVLPETPSGARNEGIHRSFIAVPRLSPPTSLSAWETRRQELTGILTRKLLRGLGPRDVPFSSVRTPVRNWTDRYADGWNVQFLTEPHVHVTGQLFLPKKSAEVRGAVLYVKGADDLVYGIDYDDLLSLLPNYAVLVLRPRAVDYRMTNLETAETKMAAALLGTTLETLQLHDVLRAVDFLLETEGVPKGSVSVYARNSMAMTAIYAGATDTRIARVIVERPPESHWDGPAVLHALRFTDLPEVAALIAPRELAFVGRIPAAYRSTEKIAQLYAGGKRLSAADSLGDAVRSAPGK
jgi:cephalosporin-C deacetylase-like acetyl esterase